MSRKPANWQWFVDLLCSNEKGQVEPAEEAVGDDLPAEAFDTGGEAKAEEETKAETVEEEDTDTPEELKPQEGLAPELEKHRAGMHRAFTKAREKISAREAQLDADDERSQVVDKFFNDKQYSAQVVQDWAKQNGYQITRAGAVAPATVPGTQTAQPAPQYVELVRANLPEELQAFAPSIAQSTQALIQQMLAPMQAAQKQRDDNQTQVSQEARTEEVGTLMEGLDKDAPGWQEHEDEMMEMLDFFESSNLSHKRFGSKAKLLLNLVTGNAQATNDAAERMRSAARHKGVKPQASKGPNTIADRIAKAGSDDEVWDYAISDALDKYSGSMQD